MHGETSNNPRERIERQWRVTSAFFESAIGSSAALESLLTRLYRKDPESLAHAHRVAALATRIGEELGLAERALDDLERAALLASGVERLREEIGVPLEPALKADWDLLSAEVSMQLAPDTLAGIASAGRAL